MARVFINNCNLIIYEAIQNALCFLIAFLTILLSPCKIRNHIYVKREGRVALGSGTGFMSWYASQKNTPKNSY